ncbi:MAG TPA: hypothetical protein VGP92_18625 [Acidimicrobiia bacterium]|nr:hypothetical protein [Acidimicrobiia bacterium]
MLTWFAFGAIFGVWNVFQSPGLDFRLIAAGALLPELIDLPFGAQAYAHTLLAAVVVLLVTMLATTGRGRRLRRRRALGLAIGWFSGLVLSAAWTHKEVFWWPAFGTARPDVALFPVWSVVVVEELLGLAAAWWVWSRFGLRDPDRRRELVRSGRLTIAAEAE